MTEKKPQTGEWWECDFARVRIVGHRLDGVAITEAEGGYIGCIKDLTGWKHLTGCDSFEWESPDDWVTQDRVPDRPGIDQWRRIWNGSPTAWETSAHNESHYLHGHVCVENGAAFEVRCRRRDLPLPKPNYVRLWTHRTSGTVCSATDERYLKYPDIWTELKHDGTGFYLAAD